MDTNSHKLRSFFESLTPDQKRLALSYEGPETHGDPSSLLKPPKKIAEPSSTVME